MKLSEKMMILADWLKNPENEILVQSEKNDLYLEKVAFALVAAADILKETAEEIVDEETSSVSPETLEEMAALATAFDESGDDILRRQASVIDEILFTFGNPPNTLSSFKKAQSDKIDDLKKKYKETREESQKNINAEDALKAIKESQVYQEYKPHNDMSLSTRYCPSHPGEMLQRAEGDGNFVCPLDGQRISWREGFTLTDGTKIPGGSVEGQGHFDNTEYHQVFDTREGRLGL